MPQKNNEAKGRLELIEKIRKEIDSFPHLKRGYSKEREELIDLHLTLGYLYSDLPEFQGQSLQEFLIAHSLTKELGDMEKFAHINGIIASMYLAQLDYSSAISYYEESIQLLKTTKYNKEMMITKKGLGIAYLKTRNVEKGVLNLTNAAEICVDLGDIDNYMEIITILGVYYKEQQEWDTFIDIETKALKILLDMGADEEISKAYLDLGIAYSKLKRNSEALAQFKQTVNYAIKSESNLLIYQGIIMVAETYFHLRYIEEAKKEYLQALSMAYYLGMQNEVKKTKMVLLTLGATEEELHLAEKTGKMDGKK
ncbi:MAG: hypothetical protein JW776_06475 [Candidatus Lokiarchaeota archaeon]|nr:hypothetical protein [Candidatus Lokiarchaeota archaeon]